MSKDLLKWQSLSLVSRFFSVGIGITQSVILTRWIFTVEEFGIIGIISAVGASIGVYQHLGLASGTARELAARDEKSASKVLISSLIARYAVSLPLSIGLFVLAGGIALSYKHPEMAGPLRIFAILLLLQASQDVGNAVLQGLQRFKRLFLFQAFLAVLSIVLYVPLSYYFKFNGYFLALSIVTLVSVSVTWWLVVKPLQDSWQWPSKQELWPILRGVFSVGLAIYIVKIIFTNWKNLGTVFLGTQVSVYAVGLFSYALGYALKLMTVSDALTDVNLSVMTKLFTTERGRFQKIFLSNFNKVYAFVWLAGTSAIFWAPEIFHLFVKDKFDGALPYVLPLVVAIWGYSYINYLGASVIVPAKEVVQMIVYYLVMMIGTVGFYFGMRGVFPDVVYLMALAMAVGALLSMFYQVLLIRFKVGFWVFDKVIGLVTLSLFPLLVSSFVNWSFADKILLSVVCYLLFMATSVRYNIVNKNKILGCLRLVKTL